MQPDGFLMTASIMCRVDDIRRDMTGTMSCPFSGHAGMGFQRHDGKAVVCGYEHPESRVFGNLLKIRRQDSQQTDGAVKYIAFVTIQ